MNSCKTCGFYEFKEPCSYRGLYVDPDMSCSAWRAALKPCPFCRGAAYIERTDEFGYLAACCDCEARTAIWPSADMAANAWDGRAE